MLIPGTVFTIVEKREEEASAPVLGQDKGTPRRTGAASSEPPYATQPAHAKPKHHGSQKRQLYEVSGCVTREVFARLEIMRHAGQKNEESRSSFVGRFVTQGVNQAVDLNYLSQIEPALERIIDRKFKSFENRFTNRFLGIIARIAYQVFRFVPLQIGFFSLFIKEKDLHDIEVRADTAVRENATGKISQVDEIMKQLKEKMEGTG